MKCRPNPQIQHTMELKVTKPLKNGEIVINGFVFPKVTHIQLKGHGDKMEFVKLFKDGEELAHLNVMSVRGTVFTHSLVDKRVITEMFQCCPNFKGVHNS